MSARDVVGYILLLITLSALGYGCALIVSSPALAHGSYAVHNHNGNETLDYYRADGFNGNLGRTVERFNSVASVQMRQVDDPLDADVIYEYREEQGAAFRHRPRQADVIWISPDSKYPESSLKHETMHLYGASHHDCTREAFRTTLMACKPLGRDILIHDEEYLTFF